MKKSLFLSSIIHGLLVVAMFIHTIPEKGASEGPLEIELAEGSDENGDSEQGSEEESMPPNVAGNDRGEIIEGGEGDGEAKFYWGLGINVLHTPDSVYVRAVYDYCGKKWLKVDDIITHLDDIPIRRNDKIAGDGPLKYVLTIVRNGATMRVRAERCKIYTKD